MIFLWTVYVASSAEEYYATSLKGAQVKKQPFDLVLPFYTNHQKCLIQIEINVGHKLQM